MQPRYQVFVSSTFRDLREERQAILEAILELGHFPAGMEAFPAADATPWELIRSIIADSDYYILIVGGKYGSTGPEGISYTEMEFNLAIELGKPVLAFVHGAPEQIPAGKSELEPEARRRLDAFRAHVAERHCKSWKTKDELKAAVLLALVHAIRTEPAFGWIRNEGLENQELLKRLAGLQARYDSLYAEANDLRALVGRQTDADRFQNLDEKHALRFTVGTDKDVHTTSISWSDLFFGLADEMLIPGTEYKLRQALKPLIVGAITNTELATELMRFRGDAKSLEKDINTPEELITPVLRQLMAKGLVEPQLVLRQSGDQNRSYTASDRCWVLTPTGRSMFLAKSAVLRENAG